MAHPSHRLSYRGLALGLALGVAAACSPASPIAPDPGQVNIPGLPINTGEFPGAPSALPTPTPRPTRSAKPLPTPTPWATPLPTPTPWATPVPTPTPAVSASPDAGEGAAAFHAALAAKGVVLTDEQLEAVRGSITARPSGEWGTKGELTPEETLADDFSRYKLRFNPPHQDVKTYRAAAVAFAGGRSGTYYLDLQFFQKFEQPLIAKWDEKTRRFLVITSDGAVSTYTAVASLAAARYIPVPTDL